MIRFVLAAEQERERIDKVLSRLMPETSRATVQRWIAEGRVTLNGEKCRGRDPALPGAVVEVEPGLVPASQAVADPNVRFGVLYDDPYLVVIDKPAGLVVHPARGHASGTLVNGLLSLPGFERAPADPRDVAGWLRPGVVHRLDKDTSGVLVVAKTERAREALKSQLSAHSVERVYRALTLGVPVAGKVESFYGRDPRSRVRFSSLVKQGKRAVTHVRVLERLANDQAALVECRLETGRTHQIRVHLSQQRKTPLLGDALYGRSPQAPELKSIAEALGRQALHAAVLGFLHPENGESMRFESPLPDDFARALEALRGMTATGSPKKS